MRNCYANETDLLHVFLT